MINDFLFLFFSQYPFLYSLSLYSLVTPSLSLDLLTISPASLIAAEYFTHMSALNSEPLGHPFFYLIFKYFKILSLLIFLLLFYF